MDRVANAGQNGIIIDNGERYAKCSRRHLIRPNNILTDFLLKKHLFANSTE
jgi:hypothetical protein